MAWYSAHLVTYFKLKNASQDSYEVWENVVLIEAVDNAEAMTKAEEFGRLEAKQSAEDKTLTVNDQPAEIIFAGVRKLGQVFHRGQDKKLENGDEVTFNSFVVADIKSIKQLMEGEEVLITNFE